MRCRLIGRLVRCVDIREVDDGDPDTSRHRGTGIGAGKPGTKDKPNDGEAARSKTGSKHESARLWSNMVEHEIAMIRRPKLSRS